MGGFGNAYGYDCQRCIPLIKMETTRETIFQASRPVFIIYMCLFMLCRIAASGLYYGFGIGTLKRKCVIRKNVYENVKECNCINCVKSFLCC